VLQEMMAKRFVSRSFFTELWRPMARWPFVNRNSNVCCSLNRQMYAEAVAGTPPPAYNSGL